MCGCSHFRTRLQHGLFLFPGVDFPLPAALTPLAGAHSGPFVLDGTAFGWRGALLCFSLFSGANSAHHTGAISFLISSTEHQKWRVACVPGRLVAQPRGKPAVICLPMSFPHPLQNRVPRVQVLLPLPKKPGIMRVPGFFFLLSISFLGAFYHFSISPPAQ